MVKSTEFVSRNGRGATRYFMFGETKRRLFGTFHPAMQGVGSLPRSMLLCPPFGQEAIRLHRFIRVLADRLSRQGIPVMRFDYFGTGDADGDDEDGDLDGWSRDVHAAQAELRSHAPGTAVTWLGVGLGAAVGMLAARDQLNGPARLVMWNPVVHGRDYLERLRTKHVDTLEDSYPPLDPKWRRRLISDPSAFDDQAIGFALSPRLRSQILTIGPETIGRDVTCDLDVVAEPDAWVVRDWTSAMARPGQQVSFHPLQSQIEWTDEELRGSALVPPAPLKTLLAICGSH